MPSHCVAVIAQVVEHVLGKNEVISANLINGSRWSTVLDFKVNIC